MNATKLMMAAALAVGSIASTTMIGCGTAPPTAAEAMAQKSEAKTALMLMKDHDSTLADSLSKAYGYVVFPSVGKGAVVVGVGGGGGEIYKQGQLWGTANVTIVTVGASLGGESYAELIVFQDEKAFNSFTNNELKFDSTAAAVAVRANVATKLNYEKGVAVVVDNTKGLMGDASLGGQQFTAKQGNPTTAPSGM